MSILSQEASQERYPLVYAGFATMLPTAGVMPLHEAARRTSGPNSDLAVRQPHVWSTDCHAMCKVAMWTGMQNVSS
jgi:hypothetical protein